MSDALTCEKCGADLDMPFVVRPGRPRDHHPIDCAALTAANARIAELEYELGHEIDEGQQDLAAMRVERDELRAQLAAARADTDRLRQQAVGG